MALYNVWIQVDRIDDSLPDGTSEGFDPIPIGCYVTLDQARLLALDALEGSVSPYNPIYRDQIIYWSEEETQ